MRLDGKIALITGASGGLGNAIARELRSRGARLVLTGRSSDSLKRAAEGDDLRIAGDLASDAFREELISSVDARFGGLDLLVNCAGVGLYASSDKAPMELVRKMFEVNLFAPLDLSQRSIPLMRRRRGGMIVNVSSIAGRITLPWFTLYSASKFALCAMTEGMRMEFGHEGIHLLTALPGYIRTPFQDNVLGGQPPESIRRMKRFAVTAELCAARIRAAIENDAKTVVTPQSGALLFFFAKLFPGLTETWFAGIHRKAGRNS